MSSAAPSKRQRQPNTLPSGKGVLSWLRPFFTASVGNKVLVALTGIVLTGYVVAHMAGNFLIFSGQDAINAYAKGLKDFGPLLWAARVFLLAAFVLHVFLAVRLKLRSKRARPVPYAYKQTIQASLASRTMLTTGVVILAFLLFHLAHLTFGWVGQVQAWDRSSQRTVTTDYLSIVDARDRHDVYSMVVAGFRNPVISVFYLIAQAALLLHLAHGVSSLFQSLGWNSPRLQPFLKGVGWAVALLVAVGNIAIVAAVWGGLVPEVTTFTVTGQPGPDPLGPADPGAPGAANP